jgi:hypothetical protein
MTQLFWPAQTRAKNLTDVEKEEYPVSLWREGGVF